MKLKKMKSLLYSQKIAPYVFILPFIVVLLVFYAYPVVSSVIMSFQNVVPGKTQWVGFANYKQLITSDFPIAVRTSVIYTIITCVVLVPLPMLFAALLNSKKMPASGLFRSILFLPALVSVVVGGLTFRLIFGEMPTALINSFIGKFGLAPIKWIGGPAIWTTFFALLILCCWRWMGVNIMYYLSGLQSISPQLYESAQIDGASSVQRFLYITVPLLKPTAVYVLTISIYGGLAMFLESYMLFGGNRSPRGVGLTIVGFLYRVGWEQANIGFGATVGLVLLAATLTLNLIQLKGSGFFRKE